MGWILDETLALSLYIYIYIHISYGNLLFKISDDFLTTLIIRLRIKLLLLQSPKLTTLSPSPARLAGVCRMTFFAILFHSPPPQLGFYQTII